MFTDAASVVHVRCLRPTRLLHVGLSASILVIGDSVSLVTVGQAPPAYPAMKTRSDNAAGKITIGACQVCNQLREEFYLCDRNHNTCGGCKKVRSKTSLQPPVVGPRLSPSIKRVRFSLPSTPESDQGSSPSTATETPSSDAGKSPEPQPRQSRSPSNDPPSIFSYRSPIKSLVTIPKAGGCDSGLLTPEPERPDFYGSHSVRDSRTVSERLSPPTAIVVGGDGSDTLEIFCQACNEFVEVTKVSLPSSMLESLISKSFDSVELDADLGDDDHEDFDSAVVPTTSVELCKDEGLKKDVENLRIGLATAYSELLTTRCDLDDVICATEKLEMDVDMLRGGVNFFYFNFDSIVKQKEVRIEERICGIPFVLMVRMRTVSRVPQLGFFIGLEPYEGRAHSPLKKIIVFRAHNIYGKVIEKHTLATFEKGKCAHPCFDLTKRQDQSLWGYANFLRKSRILKPDMLKDGRLCLSIQVKPL